MKYLFFLVLFAASSFDINAQRTAEVLSSPDFKTIKDGYVESVFVLSTPLTTEESSYFQTWATTVAPNVLIHLEDTGLSLKVSPDYNTSAVYAKLFYQLKINEISHRDGDGIIALPVETFFNKFNL